jgi:3-methyladenine DNA glycosylase Mpg
MRLISGHDTAFKGNNRAVLIQALQFEKKKQKTKNKNKKKNKKKQSFILSTSHWCTLHNLGHK